MPGYPIHKLFQAVACVALALAAPSPCRLAVTAAREDAQGSAVRLPEEPGLRSVLGAVPSMNAGPSAAPWPLVFPLVAETQRFSIHARGREPVQVERSESYLSRIEGLLGQRVLGRVTYYRYDTSEELARATGMYAVGVTFVKSREIHSTLSFHPHEIVHLVSGQLGNPGTFFHEGLAVALGDEGRWNGRNVHTLAKPVARSRGLTRLIRDFESVDPEVAYPAAGSFVASLIRAHGIASVATFFRACNGSAASREQAFEASFGLTLDQAANAWASGL
jgi:hypothetical protein